jgi:hypothetical protein
MFDVNVTAQILFYFILLHEMNISRTRGEVSSDLCT